MLRFRRHALADDVPLVMAIVNRTPDSFYDEGATWDEQLAHDRVAKVVAEGADIVDIGGVKAGIGPDVDTAEEIRRVVPFIEAVRAAHPGLVISVDTWRKDVARAALAAGADVINDAWGGWEPDLVEAVAEFDAGLICTHASGATPRKEDVWPQYDDVVSTALTSCLAYAGRAVEAGVARESIVIDPAHDFAKNTLHSLELTRRLGEFVDAGWPVLVSLSNKDFVGETLDRAKEERLAGTLAATSIAAYQGARIFRAHNVAETRDVVDMAWAIAGRSQPRILKRGL